MLIAANNATARNNHQSESLRVPEPLWRLETDPQKDIFRNLQRVVRANRKIPTSNTTTQRQPKQHNLSSSILPPQE